MADFYDELLKATDNLQDITFSRYGTVTLVNGDLCNVKEEEQDITHINVSVLNKVSVETGDKVVLGFVSNSLYNPVVMGNLTRGDNGVEVDSELSVTSINPVQNKTITGALNDKANISHNHNISDVNSLQVSLDGKSDTGHTHTKSGITDFPNIPSASSTTPSADTTNGSVGTGTTWARSNHTHPKSSLYAEASHNHTIANVTNLQTTLDGKANSVDVYTKAEINTALDWQEYRTISASTFEYKILYNHTFAKLTYWTTDTQNQTTNWVNYGSSLLSDEWIRPTHPIIIFESGGDMAIRVNNDRSQLSHRSMTGSSWTASGVYVEGYWAHRGVP